MKRSTRFKAFLYSFAVFMVLLICSGCDNGSAVSIQAVQVHESEYHISSDITTFTTGQNYHFVVKNDGKVAHEVMLMPKAIPAIGNASMNHDQMPSLVNINVINPGETKTVDYTFLASMKGTHPQFACYYEGHYEAGMLLNLSVK